MGTAPSLLTQPQTESSQLLHSLKTAQHYALDSLGPSQIINKLLDIPNNNKRQ